MGRYYKQECAVLPSHTTSLGFKRSSAIPASFARLFGEWSVDGMFAGTSYGMFAGSNYTDVAQDIACTTGDNGPVTRHYSLWHVLV